MIRNTVRQMSLYAMSGGTAAVVDIGLFHLLVVWGGAVFASACGSFVVAVVVNYVLTSSFVFPVRQRTVRQAGQFMLFHSLGFVLNIGLTTLIYQSGVAPTLAKTIAVGIVFFSNFFVIRNVVFSEANAGSVAAPLRSAGAEVRQHAATTMRKGAPHQ